MSLQLIQREIGLIASSPHPPSQASFCMGLTTMATVAKVINYQQQSELEHQIRELERQHWLSKGVPA